MIMSGVSLAAGGANVIMQLSRLPVGRGIVESTVESGALFRHPFKRTRTTLGFIMIAILGTDRERAQLRSEVYTQHRSVKSGTGSDVTYDAFDPDLQLWVAACMYRGLEDTLAILYGHLNEATLDTLYCHSARLATTLQVPRSMWPANRAAYEEYWRGALQLVATDSQTRAFLQRVASLQFLPRPLATVFGPLHRFVTTGFLSEPFRTELALPWNPRRQALFTTFTGTLRIFNRLAPKMVREFPWNLSLRSARRRLHTGRSFV